MSETFCSIDELRKAYARKENIAQLLSEQGGLNREEVIEIAYDIQSGSYTEAAMSSPEQLQRYAKKSMSYPESIFLIKIQFLIVVQESSLRLAHLVNICPNVFV